MNWKISLILGSVGIIVAFFIAFAVSHFPIPGDYIFFFVPAINFGTGEGLINQLVPLAHQADATGAFRFIFYVPLFPLFLGSFVSLFGTTSIFAVVATINSVAIIISAYLLYKIATLKKQLNWYGGVVLSLMLFSLAGYFYKSRPEVLARIFFLIAILLPFKMKKEWLWLPWGILIGLTGATQPFVAILFLIGCFIFYAATLPIKSVFVHTLKTGIAGIFTFFLIMQLSPFSLQDTLEGMYFHEFVYLQERVDRKEALDIFNPAGSPVLRINLTHHGLLLLILTGTVFSLIKRYWSKIQNPKLLVVLSAVWILIEFHRSVLYGHTYNFYFFFPFIFAGWLYILNYETKNGIVKSFAAVIFLVLSLLNFARYIIIFPAYIKDGMRLEEARYELNSLTQQTEDIRLSIKPGLWLLPDNYNKVSLWSELAQDKNTLLLLDQTSYGRPEPPKAVKNCPLIKNYFITEKAMLFGIKVALTVPGYAFAAYKCEARK